MRTLEQTVAGAFAATAHRHRGLPAVHHRPAEGWVGLSWGEVALAVRHVALGLQEREVGGGGVAAATTDPRHRLVVELAALSVGLAVALDPGAADVAVDAAAVHALRDAGRAVDEGAPDRFERAWQAVQPSTVALVAGGDRWTHAGVLWGTRSAAQGLDVDADDRLVLALSAASPPAFVVGRLLPALTACSVWVAPPGGLVEAAHRARPTVVVAEAGEAEPLRRTLPADPPPGRLGRALWRRAAPLAPAGLDACRAVALLEPRRAAASALDRVGVPAGAVLTVPGFAGLVARDGVPFPGVALAAGDDDRLRVRGDAAAEGRCPDGWLVTGLAVRVDDGRAHVLPDGVAP